MKILTVVEFLKVAETSDKILIVTKKNGNPRCQCRGPVSSLSYEANQDGRMVLSWSDQDGDPSIMVEPDDLIDGEEDMANGNYTHTVFGEE